MISQSDVINEKHILHDWHLESYPKRLVMYSNILQNYKSTMLATFCARFLLIRIPTLNLERSTVSVGDINMEMLNAELSRRQFRTWSSFTELKDCLTVLVVRPITNHHQLSRSYASKRPKHCQQTSLEYNC